MLKMDFEDGCLDDVMKINDFVVRNETETLEDQAVLYIQILLPLLLISSSPPTQQKHFVAEDLPVSTFLNVDLAQKHSKTALKRRSQRQPSEEPKPPYAAHTPDEGNHACPVPQHREL